MQAGVGQGWGVGGDTIGHVESTGRSRGDNHPSTFKR